MNILYLTPTAIFSGGERVTLSIAADMQRRGHTVAYAGLEGPVRGFVEGAGVPFLALPAFTPGAVRRAIRSVSPALVHAMDYRASTYAALTNAPLVAHLHSNPPWLPGLNQNSLAMAFFAARAGAILTVSGSVMAEFRYGARFLNKTLVLENAVDLAAVRRAAAAGEALAGTGAGTTAGAAGSAASDAARYDLCFVGRFSEPKQPLRFVSIVSRLHALRPGLSAVMIGDGELADAVDAELAARGLSHVVTRTGFLKNPYPFMAKSRVLIMPSSWEGFGLTAVEGMALGVPVLGSPVGGLSDILSGGAGVPCRTDADFSAAALRLLTDEKAYAAASAAALSRAERYGDLPGYFDRVAAVYRRIGGDQ